MQIIHYLLHEKQDKTSGKGRKHKTAIMQINEILKSYFGIRFLPPQPGSDYQEVMQGHDCLVLMPTGGGKSLCYQVPALAMEGTAVVISPLISLMHDQVEALKANGIPAEALNSGNDTTDELIIRRRCEGELKLLYVSPEKLINEIPLFIQQHQDFALCR